MSRCLLSAVSKSCQSSVQVASAIFPARWVTDCNRSEGKHIVVQARGRGGGVSSMLIIRNGEVARQVAFPKLATRWGPS